ncbi:MAG: lamin tail domain-containing protein, partial [Bacteroidales bacterium]|nr:lamin tail domain-containing protein [Bacteroidales bacterium]
QEEDYSNLKITEIHYHPPDIISGNDTTDGRDLEFIELKNTGRAAINLSGLVLDSAVFHEFPAGLLLAPSQFYVIASKPSYFYDEYGLVASGNYSGNLSNAGEQILLSDPQGEALMNFYFSDDYPWPEEADGDGYSLSSAEANPTGNPGDEEYWTTSWKMGGTPFADNNAAGGPEPPEKPDGTLSVYPNPSTGPVTLRLISDREINQVRITLFNLSGKPVYETIIGNPGMFDLNEKGLAAGMYIMNVAAEGYNSRIRIILVK